MRTGRGARAIRQAFRSIGLRARAPLALFGAAILPLAGILVAVTAGCSGPTFRAKPPEPVSTVYLAPIQNGQLVTIKEGHRVSVRLLDDRQGYQWALTTKPDASILSAATRRLSPASEGWAGVPGVEYSFDSLSAGVTALTLEYLPKQGGTEPASTFSVTIKVITH